jgi:protoheme ferro-lyase
LVKGSNSIFVRRKKHFSQPFNVHGVSEVKQREIQTAEPLVPQLSAFEVEMAIKELQRHKSGTNQIQEDLIKARDRTICSEINKPTNSIWME